MRLPIPRFDSRERRVKVLEPRVTERAQSDLPLMDKRREGEGMKVYYVVSFRFFCRFFFLAPLSSCIPLGVGCEVRGRGTGYD